jgi:MATE family multidrug resistance protein
VVRGCGRQRAGAFINLAAYYLAGIPLAFVFAFVWHLGGMVPVVSSSEFHFSIRLFSFLLFFIFFNLIGFSEYWFNLDSGQGLWFGIMCGLVVQMLLLLSITLFTNWNKEVSSSLFKLVLP